MKNLFTLYLVFFTVILVAQNPKVKAALDKVGDYTIDDNGYVVFTRIIEFDTANTNDLFSKAEEYFTYNYVSGEDVIQVNDRQNGRIIGKGLFKNTASTANIIFMEVDTWHIIRIEIKQNKARLSVALTEHNFEMSSLDGDSSRSKKMVSDCYPINEKGQYKNLYGEAFAVSAARAKAAMDSIEKSMRNASNDW